MLLVSGGHTQVLAVMDVGRYRRIGTTIDDALGEAFDKTAKLLGLGFPGGPAVERTAKQGDPKRFALPRPMIGRPEPHFSFAGLKTAVRHKAEASAPLSAQDVADLCAAFQQAVADAVADRIVRAFEIAEREALCGEVRRLVVAGGVAANAALRGRFRSRQPRTATTCTYRRLRCAPTMRRWWPGPVRSVSLEVGLTICRVRRARAGRSTRPPCRCWVPADWARRLEGGEF